MILQDALNQFTRIGFIVYDKDMHAGQAGQQRLVFVGGRGWDETDLGWSSAFKTVMGRLMMNVAPRPSPALLARSVPPCSSTSCLAMASPSPRPPWLRVGGAVLLGEALEHMRQVLRRRCRRRCR